MGKQSISVVVSSYNQPIALKLVLCGFAAQDDLDFEMVIADDGSDAKTLALLGDLCTKAPFRAKFTTHEHCGFGKARALNEAILQTEGEFLIFCDGDCVPFCNFVSTHKAFLQLNSFCTGGYVRLTLNQSQNLTPDDITHRRHERYLTGAQKKQLLRVHFKNLLYRRLLPFKQKEPKILGGNFSVDRRSIFAVNGFDESLQCSKEDSDIRNRLRNLGCTYRSLWNKAYVCHLNHNIDPERCTPSDLRGKSNKVFYEANRKRIRSVQGLDLHKTTSCP